MKIMYRITIAFILFSIVAILLKMMNINGSSMLLLLALMLLSGYMYLQVIIFRNVFIKTGVNVLAHITYLGLSTLFTGAAFRFLYWVGSWGMLFIGLVFTIVFCMLPLLNLKNVKPDKPNAGKYLKYNFILPLIFGAFLFIICTAIPARSFYNTFSSARTTMTYDEFVQQQQH
jgi:hypothetical protein